MFTKHIVKSYDQELSALRTKIAEMGINTKTQLISAIEALTHRSPDLAQAVIENDKRVNELQTEIDNLTVRVLATRQPLAFDLRNIVSGLKIANDLERIADNAKRIARSVAELNNINSDKPIEAIIEMSKLGQQMLSNVIDSFKKSDAQKAVQVWHSDRELDEKYTSLLAQLKTYMKEEPDKIHAYTTLIFVARCCERIGDHITNIAEAIYYVVNGKFYHGE
jgi:phosphate transport system protein